MDFGLPAGRYERINAVLSRFSSIEKVIIFGSRALNTCRPASDVDLALIGDSISHNDILKLQRELDELPYGYEYDVLDYKKIILPELKAHIDNFGVSFYQRS